MPSYGWKERNLTQHTDGSTVGSVRRRSDVVDLGEAIRSTSSLLPGAWLVFHDLEKEVIERIRIVDGKAVIDYDPRKEWRHLGKIPLLKVLRESGQEEMFSLLSLGVLPYPNSNQYGRTR